MERATTECEPFARTRGEPTGGRVVDRLNIWSRLGHWFRRANHKNRAGDVSVAESPSPGEAEVVQASTVALTDGESMGSGRFRLTRTSGTLERLEEEYKRIVKLIDAIQEHLSSQAQRSGAMIESLDRIAGGVSGSPEAARQQQQQLAKIMVATATSAASARRVEEGLLQLPQLADAQRETMVSIGRQLDLSRQTIERMAGSMDGFQQAIRNLAAVTENSTKKLEEIRWDLKARDERVAELLGRQSRRFSLFAWAVIGLAVVAAIGSVIALFRTG